MMAKTVETKSKKFVNPAHRKAKRFRSPNGYTTVEKAAVRLHVPIQKVQSLIQAGKLQGIWQNNRWFVSRDALKTRRVAKVHIEGITTKKVEIAQAQADNDTTSLSLPIPQAEYDRFAKTLNAVYQYRGQSKTAEEHLTDIIRKHMQELQALSQLMELSPGIGKLAS